MLLSCAISASTSARVSSRCTADHASLNSFLASSRSRPWPLPGELRPVCEDDAPRPAGPAGWQPALLHDAADREAVRYHPIIVRAGLTADDCEAQGKLIGGWKRHAT